MFFNEIGWFSPRRGKIVISMEYGMLFPMFWMLPCSVKAFSLVKVYSNIIKSDPGPDDVIWMTFSVVWMFDLP